MSQKRYQNHQQQPSSFPNHLNTNEETDRPFPNRFSSGEYENVQQPKLVNHQPPPPLPKRNDETHLTRDRT